MSMITYVDEVLKLFSTMAGDYRYEKVLEMADVKEGRCMCDVAERLERKGIEKGN